MLATLELVFTTLASATPVANFRADVTDGCAPLNIHFTSLATGNGTLTYHWNFGNGTFSTYQNPVITFPNPGAYTVSLLVTESSGDTNSIAFVNYITVRDTPTADFTCSGPLASCRDGNSFTFNNFQTPGVNYLWDFNDGNTATGSNPTHVFNQSGTFNVTLVATNSFGCRDQKIRDNYITIYPEPDATVSANATVACSTNAVFQFNTNNSNVVSYLWRFGDGTTSTQANPSHQYLANSTYNVSVILTTNHGCVDTTDTPLQIRIGPLSYQGLTIDNDSVCVGDPVVFRNPNTTAAGYFWNFGDGTTSSDVAPAPHPYFTPGRYHVQLIITGSDGCQTSVYDDVQIFPQPHVNFTISDFSGCAPFRVHFVNNSTNYDSCRWVFGDGGSTIDTSRDIYYTYYTSGVFSVTLQCWNGRGCSQSRAYWDTIHVSNLQSGFIADNRMGCPPLTVNFTPVNHGNNITFTWLLGNGITSHSTTPQTQYTVPGSYSVTLIASDGVCTDTVSRNNYIQTIDPVANYSAPDTTVGCAPLSTQFTDATIGTVAWTWDFDDGTVSHDQNPTHTFTRPGIYNVSLETVSAGGGCVRRIDNFRTFEVHGGWAGFTHQMVSICPPYEAQFTDTSLNAVSWFWDFGDGTTSTLQHPSHIYTIGGYHSVRLTITTADGCTYSTMQSNGVYFNPFGANFYAVPQGNTLPLDVQYFANSVGATSWQWNFGDGDSSSLENPLHYYTAAPANPISLTITNENCTLTYITPLTNLGIPDSTPVNVGNPGLPQPQIGCTPLYVSFTQDFHVPSAAQWLWDFGDGNTSELEFPTHIYYSAGNFNISVQFYDSAGNWIDSIHTAGIVNVHGPQAGFSISQSNCLDSLVTFLDHSTGANFWHWDFGDGNTSNDTVPDHIYAGGVSNFIVCQTVTDTFGCSSTTSSSLFENSQTPVLVTETDVCGFDTVLFFTNLVNYPSYVWYFGDGDSSTFVNPGHVYLHEGVYSPRLVTVDAKGCTKVYSAPDITVTIPIAAFSTDVRQGCDNLNTPFINHSVNVDSSNAVFEWDFGDGSYSSALNPYHYYRGAGSYNVTLTVYKGSCISRETKTNYIRVDTAHAAFSATAVSRCLPMSVQFNNLSTNATSYHWDFGDGTTDTTANPLHTFYAYTYTNMVLAIEDVNHCRDTARRLQISPMIPNFNVDEQKGCVPFTVRFTDNTAMVGRYYWDFGDGDTSSLRNPTHTYTRAGSYDITLVVFSQSNTGTCTDTLFMPAYIRAVEPVAGFATSDTMVCAPGEVHFIDYSSDGDFYTWDFGDGTSSTKNDSVSHVYNLPGTYTVSLMVNSDAGCGDTLVRNQYINVYGSSCYFEASAFEGCVPFTVDFTDFSADNTVSWQYIFGDGGADQNKNCTHTFTQPGTYYVRLFTRNDHGCDSYFELPFPIVVHPQPIADFQLNNPTGCSPFTLIPVNNATGYDHLVWQFHDGSIDTSISPVHLYTSAGNYPVSLIAYNAGGCADTMVSSTDVNVLPSPIPSFSTAVTTGCAGFTAQFINTTTNTAGTSYLWNFGNGSVDSTEQPIITFTSPGLYTIQLTATNTNGCSSTTISSGLIHIYDTLPPNETIINSVSVLSNTAVEIIWQNNPALDLSGYILYRKHANSNLYEAIHSEPASNNGFSLTSTYLDTGLNTLQNTYSYKVQAIDICGNTIPLEQLTAHTTVNVSSLTQDDDILVNWTAYEGCAVEIYRIYRCVVGQEMEYIGSVPGDSLHYIDSAFTCPYPYSYRIEALGLCGTTYTSWSDTTVIQPDNIFKDQVVDVVRSTVVNNRYILTEWKQPAVLPDRVVQFNIYRSKDDANFEFVAAVPAQQTEYQDFEAQIQHTKYYYKIQVVNSCDMDQQLSPSTNSIVLKGEMDDGRHVYLKWNAYTEWENGVDHYIVEKQDEQGNWNVLKQVQGATTEYDYQEQ